MKAIVFRKLGSPDVLTLEEIEKPVPKPGQVLLKVHAAATNPLDWRLLSGITPVIARAAELFIKRGVPGRDVAGVVEAVGTGVSRFAPGDAVFGTCRGAFAEYACAVEKDIVRKPAEVSFEEAAAVPIAALSALQGLRDQGALKNLSGSSGHRVLVNGAAGGVGTYAVQIAKVLGASHVAGVCSTRNVEMVRSLGADKVFDYTVEDFTQTSERYDVILDNMANHPYAAFKRLLRPEGRYVGVGAPKEFSEILAGMFGSLWYAMVDKRYKLVLAKASVADLTLIGEWMIAGKVKSVIDRRYPLEETPEALRYLMEGHAQGKVVIAVA